MVQIQLLYTQQQLRGISGLYLETAQGNLDRPSFVAITGLNTGNAILIICCNRRVREAVSIVVSNKI